MLAVATIYYWCQIKSLKVELDRIYQRKLTRATIIPTAQTTRNLEISEETIVTANVSSSSEKEPDVTSLTPLNELSLDSLIQVKEDRLVEKSKSHESLVTVESEVYVKTVDYSELAIFEDDSLKPVEKAMKILGLSRDDIDKTRLRLGKSVLYGDSEIEIIEKIISSIETATDLDNVEEIARDMPPKIDTEQSTAKTEKYTDKNILKIPANDVNTSSVKDRLKHYRNPLSSCTCKRMEREPTSKRIDSRPTIKKSERKNSRSNTSDDEFSRKSLQEINRSASKQSTKVLSTDKYSSRDYSQSEVSEEATFLPDWIQGFKKKGVGESIEKLAHSKDNAGISVELFRVNDISPLDCFKKTNENYENFKVRNLFEFGTQTDFIDDHDLWKSDADIARDVLLPGTSKISISTQTNIMHRWEKISTIRPMRPDLMKMLATRFSKTKRRLERIEERDARELRALRVYNEQTLLKDKRKIEENNRLSMVGVNFEHIPKPKRHARSRPQENTLKLSTFYLGLDDLENSISLTFSSAMKNGSKLHDAKNHSNQIDRNQQEMKKQFSKYSKPMTFSEKHSTLSKTTMEDLQMGQDLEKSPGVENITNRDTIREIDQGVNRYKSKSKGTRTHKLSSQTSLPTLSSREVLKGQELNTSVLTDFDKVKVKAQGGHKIFNIKEAIKNINWSFDDRNLSGTESLSGEGVTFNHENVIYDAIDDTDTISLLRSAFSSNPRNTERGFYLGPGSTELYSVSNHLNSVVEEIMKTASIKRNPAVFTTENTTELDYGDAYLYELEVTRLLEIDDSDKETLMDVDPDEFENNNLELKPRLPIELIPLEPIEMCWNSYSGEGFDVRSQVANEQKKIEQLDFEDYRKKMQDGNKGTKMLLGKEEISDLDFWISELKDLAVSDRLNDLEIAKQYQHLTNLPGFFVVKMIVDFLRSCVAVSHSTMTSLLFLGAETSSTPNSARSEEVIPGGFIEPSNISEVPARGIFDNPMTLRVGREQFYFGCLGNSRYIIKNISPDENLGRNTDSFDSMYSLINAKRNNLSDNVISIGNGSQLEDFPEDSEPSTSHQHTT